MHAESVSSLQSSNSFDLSTLKQRRYQYKTVRKYQGGSGQLAGNELHDSASSPFKSLANNSSQYEHGFPSPAMNPVQATPLCVSNFDDVQDISANRQCTPLKGRLLSEPSHPVKLLISPKSNYDTTKPPSVSLTPLRLASEKNSITPRDPDSQRSQRSNQGIDYLETVESEVSKGDTSRRAMMTPEGKRHSASSILHRDLLNYRAARQIAKNSSDIINPMMSQSYREVSKSQDSIRLGMNYSIDSDRLKCIMESEKKMFGNFGLDKFNTKNLEVLEEDESPSEDNDRKNSVGSRGLDSARNKGGQVLALSNLKARRKELKEKSVEREASAEAVVHKSGSVVGLNEKLEQFKVETKLSKEKTSAPLRTHKIDNKRDSKEVTESKYSTSKDVKKAQNITRTPETNSRYKVNRPSDEEDFKLDGGNTTNKSKTQGLSITIGPQSTQNTQSTHTAPDGKRLRVNNWTKTLLGSTTNQSGRVSPKAVSKEVRKGGYANESPKKKGIENKSMIVSSLKVSIPTVQLGGAGSGGSTANTVEDPDNIVITSTEQARIKEQSLKILNQVGLSSSLSYGALKRDKAPIKAAEARKPTLQLDKDTREKGDTYGIRVATESEVVKNPVTRERDSSAGREGHSTREYMLRKETLMNTMAESNDQFLSKSCVAGSVKKPATAVKNINSSPRVKPIQESKPSSAKGSPDKTKEKVMSKTIGLSGFASTSLKKQNEGLFSTPNLTSSAINLGAISKLKSPSNMLSKTLPKTVEQPQKDKRIEIANNVKPKVTSDQKLLKSSKEIRSAKQSRDWRNGSELKLVVNNEESKGKTADLSKSALQSSPQKKMPGLKTIETQGDEYDKELEDEVKVEVPPEKPLINMEVKKEEKKEISTDKTKINNHSRKNSSTLKAPTAVLKNIGLSFPLNSNKGGKSNLQSLVGKVITSNKKEK